MHLFAGRPFALEEALEDAEQAGVPVAQDEEQEERDGEEVLRGDGVPDGGGEVAADGELNPGDDAEALAVLLGLGALALLLDGVLWVCGRRRS